MITVTMPNPLGNAEQIVENASLAQMLKLFHSINWEKLKDTVFNASDKINYENSYFKCTKEELGIKSSLIIGCLKDSKFLVGYNYPNLGYKNAGYLKKQVDEAFVEACLGAFTNDYNNFFLEYFEKPGAKKRSRNKVFLFLLGLSIVCIGFIHFVIGWSHLPEHLLSLKMQLFPEKELGEPAKGVDVVDNTVQNTSDTIALSFIPEVLPDTISWNRSIARGDYIPDQVKEDLERARKFDYSKLSPSGDVPSNEETEYAIVRLYGERASSILSNNHAHIKIGKAYLAPLQPSKSNGGELIRISAMVCGINDQGINLGNIQMPIEPAYDFVKFKDAPNTWYISDLSQIIPYDYKLNK